MPLSTKAQMREVQQVAMRASERKVDSTRHKCFLSYRVTDKDEVEQFLDEFGTELIPRSVGVTEDDDFIDSEDDEYIKRRIRELYLTDSTVTILLVGRCSWSRKFIDWELSSSLRDDSVNRRNGLLGICLPSAGTPTIPARLKDNWAYEEADRSYALYKEYPDSPATLRSYIERAFAARSDKPALVDNSRPLRTTDSAC